MEYSCTQLIDLSDEILLIIFKELDCVDAFNLLGINQRLDNILHDFNIINHITLFKCSSNNDIHRLDDKSVHFFCLEILPKIHNNITSLNIESSSIERIFTVTTFPNLRRLGLYAINANTAAHLFNSKKSMFSLFFVINFMFI